MAQQNKLAKIDKEYIQKFLGLWSDLDTEYKKEFPNNRIAFPEPLQKRILIDYFDGNLKLGNSSPYDFCGNIEIKSCSKNGVGCTPFQKTQNNCKRILYLEIGAGCIDVYDLSQEDVKTINAIISNPAKSNNITLAIYKSNAKHTSLTF